MPIGDADSRLPHIEGIPPSTNPPQPETPVPKVPKLCPYCKSEVDPDASVCKQCRKKLPTIRCKCGTWNFASFVQCVNCGEKLVHVRLLDVLAVGVAMLYSVVLVYGVVDAKPDLFQVFLRHTLLVGLDALAILYLVARVVYAAKRRKCPAGISVIVVLLVGLRLLGGVAKATEDLDATYSMTRGPIAHPSATPALGGSSQREGTETGWAELYVLVDRLKKAGYECEVYGETNYVGKGRTSGLVRGLLVNVPRSSAGPFNLRLEERDKEGIKMTGLTTQSRVDSYCELVDFAFLRGERYLEEPPRFLCSFGRFFVTSDWLPTVSLLENEPCQLKALNDAIDAEKTASSPSVLDLEGKAYRKAMAKLQKTYARALGAMWEHIETVLKGGR